MLSVVRRLAIDIHLFELAEGWLLISPSVYFLGSSIRVLGEKGFYFAVLPTSLGPTGQHP